MVRSPSLFFKHIFIHLILLTYFVSMPVLSESLPEGYESYLSRPDILKLKPGPQKELEPIWNKLKPVLPDTLALLLESYPKHDIYFLARDGELLYDYAKAVLQKQPEQLKRIHLLNISRANMNDPHLVDYLAQEGISKESLKSGKNALFVDTGFSGTISKKLESMFPTNFQPQLKTHLLLSETENYPSTRVFLSGLSKWSNYLSPEELHGKIIALEHLPHFSDRSDRFLKIENTWHPVSQKLANTNGNVSSELSLVYQKDLLSYAQTSKSADRLLAHQKIWKKLYELHESKNKKKLITFFRDLKATHPSDASIEAIIRDYIDINKDSLVKNEDLGIGTISKNAGERLTQIKKDFPEWKKILDKPQEHIPALMKKGEFNTLAMLSEAAIHDNQFRSVLLKELAQGQLSPPKLTLVTELIEHSHRETLEELPKAIFSNPNSVNTPGLSKTLARFIHLAEEDALDDLLNQLIAKPHFAELKEAPELLKMVLERADDETLELIQELLANKPHLQDKRFLILKQAAEISDSAERLSFLSEKFSKKATNSKPVVLNTKVEIKVEEKIPSKIIIEKAKPFKLPDLGTDEKRLQWLLSVRENIPGLFSQSAKYDIDLMNLLDDQDKLQKLLSENPQYLKSLQEQHPNWLTVDIFPKSSEVVKTLRVKPEALEAWKANLKQTLKLFPKEKPGAKEILNALSKESEVLQNRTSFGLITGLTMSLPPEERKVIFSASEEDKLRLLETKLSEKISSDFKAVNFGLKAEPSKKEVFALLNNLRSSEHKLRDLSELHLVLQNAQGVINQNPSGHIESLQVNDLEFFTDPDAIKPRLEHLQVKNKDLEQSILKHVKSFASQQEAVEEKLGKGIKLVEMPPAMGIFRGCTGGDCSTQYSFPYPNAPNERVFYVYDNEGGLKGYATGSLVKANGKISFQLITIAGPRISSADTQMIFEGLNKIKTELKAEQLLLPTKERVASLINFQPIRAIYDQAIDNRPLVDIKYIDTTERSSIEKFSSEFNNGSYDKMATNTQGVVYVESKDFPIQVEVSKRAQDVKELTKLNLQQSASEFALELVQTDRMAQVSRVMNAAKIPATKHQEILGVLSNDKGLTIPAYQEKLKKLLGYSDAEFAAKKSIFIPGYFNAPDFSALENDPKFVDYVISRFNVAPTSVSEKINSKALIKEIIERGETHTLSYLSIYFFSRPETKNMEDLLIPLIEKGESQTLYHLAKETFSRTHTNKMEKAFKLLMEKGDSGTLQQIAHYILEESRPELIKYFFERADHETLQELATYGFQYAKQSNIEEALKLTIEKGDNETLAAVAKNVFSLPSTSKMENTLKLLIEKADQETLRVIVNEVFSQPHSVNFKEAFELLISKANAETLQHIATYAFEHPHMAKMQNALVMMINRGDPETLQNLAQYSFSEPTLANMPEALELLVEKGDKKTLQLLGQHTFSEPHAAKMERALIKLIEKGDRETLRNLAETTFSEAHTKNMKDALKLLIEKGDKVTLQNLAEHAFSQPHTKDMQELFKLLIEKGDKVTRQNLANYAFSEPHTAKMPELIKLLIEKGDSKTLQYLAVYTFSQPHTKDMNELFKRLIEKGDSETLQDLATYTFREPHTQNKPELMRLLIEKADEKTVENLKRYSLDRPHWRELPQYSVFDDAIAIKNLAKRKAFLDKHLGSTPAIKTPKIQKEIVTLKVKETEFKTIGADLNSGEVVKTEKGKKLTIMSFVDEGLRGKVYKVKDDSGKEFALKVARDSNPETLESMNKETIKAVLYQKYKIPHAKIIESNSEYALKEWVEGIRADEWIKTWVAKGSAENASEMKDLKKLISSTAKSGVYVGDLNPKNLIWNGAHWIVIDSGGIKEGLPPKESLEKFLEKIPSRWSKDENGERCPMLFKNLVKTLTP